ncbi:MAG: glycogen synthase [Desulfatiglandaceae bacterium]
MRIALITKEYPPNVYGGAGVHISHLARSLTEVENRSHDIDVFHFGTAEYKEENLRVKAVAPCPAAHDSQPGMSSLLDALHRDASLTGMVQQADIIHCHTWYTHLAGCLLAKFLSIPLVLTTHSLEPHRPWKREQLGGGYNVSSWIERTAYCEAHGIIAVSGSMKKDVENLYGVAPARITVIPNGVDTAVYKPMRKPEVLGRYRIDPEIPYVLMVSRITRQKGITHFLNACRKFQPPVQIVLCASTPDTEQIKKEVEHAIGRLTDESPNPIIWVKDTVPENDLPILYSHAAVFVCPSVYEPFGIINLEAMSCGTPVVASDVGGIPDAVLNGETGFLVSFEPRSNVDPEPIDPEKFAEDLAASVNRIISDPDLRSSLGRAARRRVVESFSWKSIAEQTLSFYRSVLKNANER